MIRSKGSPLGGKDQSRVDRILEAPAFSWFLIAVGVVTRLRQYFMNRSLWWDEANLALNIVDRSYVDLLEPLALQQAVRCGVAMAQRICMRLVPLLSSRRSIVV